MSRRFPILVQFTLDDLDEIDPMDQLTQLLDDLSFQTEANCFVCDQSLKDKEMIYINRCGWFYHKRCYNHDKLS